MDLRMKAWSMVLSEDDVLAAVDKLEQVEDDNDYAHNHVDVWQPFENYSIVDLENIVDGFEADLREVFNANKPEIIIEVNGGLVQEVYSKQEFIDYMLVDYDNLKAGDPFTEEFYESTYL